MPGDPGDGRARRKILARLPVSRGDRPAEPGSYGESGPIMRRNGESGPIVRRSGKSGTVP